MPVSTKAFRSRIDRPAAISVLAWSTHPLKVADQDQTGVEGVGRECHVCQVKRRANEGEPVGDAFQGFHAALDRVGVLGREPSMSMSEPSMPASRASWRSSRVLGLISTLSIIALKLGVALRASSTHCNVKAVFPAPGAPPMSVTSPGPISILASSPVPTG